MSHANPGLRPGLSSAVPTGLDFEMVVLRQTLKAVPLKEKRTSGPKGLICFGRCDTAESRALRSEFLCSPVKPSRSASLSVNKMAVSGVKKLSSRPEESWACGPSKVMKNVSVQQLLSIEPLPFPFVIPSEAEGSAVPLHQTQTPPSAVTENQFRDQMLYDDSIFV
jgi:hypothetical protein